LIEECGGSSTTLLATVLAPNNINPPNILVPEQDVKAGLPPPTAQPYYL
jgi:hypothetical protein